MAGVPGVRRALAREDVEMLVAQVDGLRPLPTIYLHMSGEEAAEQDRYAGAQLLRVRANGFMVLLPDVDHVRAYVSALVNEFDEALALTHRDQVQVETVRGRHLGPARVLLADFPWTGVEFFVTRNPLRGASDRQIRLSMLQVGGVNARPQPGDALDAATREYYESAREVDAGDEEDQPQKVPLLSTAPKAAAVPPRRRGEAALFQAAPPLAGADLKKLRQLAGSAPPRVGGLERGRRAVEVRTEADLREADGRLEDRGCQGPGECCERVGVVCGRTRLDAGVSREASPFSGPSHAGLCRDTGELQGRELRPHGIHQPPVNVRGTSGFGPRKVAARLSPHRIPGPSTSRLQRQTSNWSEKLLPTSSSAVDLGELSVRERLRLRGVAHQRPESAQQIAGDRSRDCRRRSGRGDQDQPASK